MLNRPPGYKSGGPAGGEAEAKRRPRASMIYESGGGCYVPAMQRKIDGILRLMAGGGFPVKRFGLACSAGEPSGRNAS